MPTQHTKQASGIVLLFDVVGHSEQIKYLGDTICDEALNIFLVRIKIYLHDTNLPG